MPSLTTNFSVTRDEIITEALQLLGALDEGDSPSTSQITSSARILNMMVKAWQADKMNLFAVDRYALFVRKNQQSYSLYSETPDHFTKVSQIKLRKSVGVTPINSVTIELDTVDGLEVADFIGIATGSDVQWTNVAAIVDSMVTLDDFLIREVPAESEVWTYRTKASRPMKIMEGYVHITKSNSDIPLGHISRRKYGELTKKDARGLVNQYYFDPQISEGNLYVWPTGDNEIDYVELIVQRTLEDLNSALDDPDYPQEWDLALSLNLAVLLAPKYGIPPDIYRMLSMRAQEYYEICKNWDNELYTSTFVSPDTRFTNF